MNPPTWAEGECRVALLNGKSGYLCLMLFSYTNGDQGKWLMWHIGMALMNVLVGVPHGLGERFSG